MQAEQPNKTPKYIVAIGASAGGLEALENFFSHNQLPEEFTYIVIQHLLPDHKSMMQELLARYTNLNIEVIHNNQRIAANTIYLIPPGVTVSVNDWSFTLEERPKDALSLPIDILFTSLAKSHAARTIAVILSGTGSDGSNGVEALKDAGATILTQECDDAGFSGMPASAIATNCVDASAKASELPNTIKNILNQKAANFQEDDATGRLLEYMLEQTGIDFSQYKWNTINRRLIRRLQATRQRDPSLYLDYLKNTPEEVNNLYLDFLIPVTCFFRDDQVFEFLKNEIIYELCKRHDNQPLRIWVCGCSTGEEAYSLAILFKEVMEEKRLFPQLKIFATDVNENNIRNASVGLYSHSIAEEISETRLQKYFIATTSGYQIHPDIRQHIVFARHNLISDPPFIRMDLISCRNTLIYLQSDSQRNIINNFNHSLNPDGYLLLGTSESTQGVDDRFQCVNDSHSLYQVSKSSQKTVLSPIQHMKASNTSAKSQYLSGNITSSPLDPQNDELISLLIRQYAPITFVIDIHSLNIIRTIGNAQPFLKELDENLSTHVNDLVIDDLKSSILSLVVRTKKSGEIYSGNSLILTINGKKIAYKLTSNLINSNEKNAVAVSLIQQSQNTDDSAEDNSQYVRTLEQELAATRQDLKVTIEELETTNEELQAANEELMASNEELQSSNEELQSVNEELNTVNAEYQAKVSQLNQLNSDLKTMINASGVATVFVDEELKITRFSPEIRGIFSLRDNDIGRPLNEIRNNSNYHEIIDDLEKAVATQSILERETATKTHQYIARVTPYIDQKTNTRAAVATFIDISDFQRAEKLQSVIDALPEHIALLDKTGDINMVNHSWQQFACENGDPEMSSTGIGRNYLASIKSSTSPDEADLTEIYLGIKNVIEGRSKHFFIQYPCHSPDEQRWFLMSAAPVANSEHAAVVSHFNITPWKLGKPE